MVDGKAVLLRDDYCDGLGDCLPTCPTGAISFIEKETLPYDEAAVKENQKKKEAKAPSQPCGCPGTKSRKIEHGIESECEVSNTVTMNSRLSQWPVQIKLAPVNAPYFQNANLLIAADCTAYAYGNFHNHFIKNRITLIGCPKLDSGDYADKLTEILISNDIKSLMIVRMEVPCCGGLENAAKEALQRSGKFIPWQVVTISTDGEILE
jgi:hypothetical protein